MPFYNNSRIGGAMDGTHIYYNTSISNNWSGTQIKDFTIYVPNTVYYIGQYVYSSGYYLCTINPVYDSNNNPIPQSAPPSAPWTLQTLSQMTDYIDTNTKEQFLEFNQTRAQPYLSTPSDYYMSVQRFTIESPNLPVFIAQPIVGLGKIDDDSYETIYKVFIDNTLNGGDIASSTVKWFTQDTTVPLITTPITTMDTYSPLFYCYSYSYFIQMVNLALASCLPTNPDPPIMQFNPVNGLFSIQGWVDRYRTKIDGTPLGITTPVKVFFNTELYNLFSSLSSIYVAGGVGLPIGADYQILFTTGTDVLSTLSQPYAINILENTVQDGKKVHVINNQEYTTLPLWSPIKSIVFTASLLNVVSEMVATPTIFEKGNKNINAGKQNTDILPILIEHSVPQTSGTEYKPFIFYEPQGEYRLADLYSDTPVSGLQYKVYWKDTFGNLNPFKLAIGASSTLKILFRKKLFNSDQV